MNLLTFFPWANRPTQSMKTPVSVACHGASQEIRDFDAAIAYFFSAQALFQADATSHEHYVPPLVNFSKISKILTQTLSRKPLSGKPPYTSCPVLARRKGATEVVGFFGSSLRAVADKQDLGAFRGKQLKEAYEPIQLNVLSSSLPPYGFCAETIPLQSNLVLWVPHLALISTDNQLIATGKKANSSSTLRSMALQSIILKLRKWRVLPGRNFAPHCHIRLPASIVSTSWRLQDKIRAAFAVFQPSLLHRQSAVGRCKLQMENRKLQTLRRQA